MDAETEKAKQSISEPESGQIAMTPEQHRDARHLSRAMGYVRTVCKAYEKCRQIELACHKTRKNSNTFYSYLRKYEECRRLAATYGLGLGTKLAPKEVLKDKIAKPGIQKPEADPDYDLPRKKVWTPKAKEKAIETIMEVLKIGVPFPHAVRYAGAKGEVLQEWFDEDPELIDRMQQAESAWAVYFFKCLSTAAKVAAEKGKFAELVEGAERRFAQQWAKVQAIDLTIKNETAETNYNENKPVAKSELDSLADVIDAQFSKGDEE
jgi:hypothetical protein